MFDCVWCIWYTLQLMYFWAPLIYLMISWYLFDTWFRHIYYPILKFGDYVDFMSINKYVCLTTPPPSPTTQLPFSWFWCCATFFFLNGNKADFFYMADNENYSPRFQCSPQDKNLPTFKQDFVFKRICILPSGSTFNPRCHEFETMLVWYIATTKL